MWILRPHLTCCGIRFAPVPPHSNLLILLWKYGKPWRVSYNLTAITCECKWMRMRKKSIQKSFSHHPLEQDKDYLWDKLLKTCTYLTWHPCCLSQLVAGNGHCWGTEFSNSGIESNCPDCGECEAGLPWWGSALSGDQEIGMPILTGWLRKSWGPWHVSHPRKLHSRVLRGKWGTTVEFLRAAYFPSRHKQRDRHKIVAFWILHWELVYAWLPCWVSFNSLCHLNVCGFVQYNS